MVWGSHKLNGTGRVFDCDWTGGVYDSPCNDIDTTLSNWTKLMYAKSIKKCSISAGPQSIISILPMISNLLENHVDNPLYQHLSNNFPLSPNQLADHHCPSFFCAWMSRGSWWWRWSLFSVFWPLKSLWFSPTSTTSVFHLQVSSKVDAYLSI